MMAPKSRTPDDKPDRAGGNAPVAVNDNDDGRPTIQIANGDVARVVDEAEGALIARGGLFQRANEIVFVGEVPVLTADNLEVSAQRILVRGEHALLEDLASAAKIERFDVRKEDWIRIHPPGWIVRTLQDRIGRLRFPVLTGIINAPTLRPDGSLLAKPGYDAKTGLYLDTRGMAFPGIREKPSRTDAERAMQVLDGLVSTFPFVADADRSVALSAILTACVRQSLATAPLHAFSAPVAGSGKSKLVDIASVIATGREAGVIAQGKTEEETEKRLGAMFRAGDAIVSIDNCEAPLGGEFLCQVLTQTSVRVRILGFSEAPEFSTRAFVAATGNNLVIVGDMTRRALLCQLDPAIERPELRTFAFEPVARTKAERGRLVRAALTILLAYHAAGRPDQVIPLGSFEQWSSLVRSAVVWLGRADPVATMERARASDPRLDELASVLLHWSEVIGRDRVTVRKVIETAIRQDYANNFEHPDLREALFNVAAQGGLINQRRLGRWLGAHAKRVHQGRSFEQAGIVRGDMTWQLVER